MGARADVAGGRGRARRGDADARRDRRRCRRASPAPTARRRRRTAARAISRVARRHAAAPHRPDPRPPAPPAPHHHRGDTMSMVKRPTLEQMHEIVGSLHLSMSEREVGEYLEVLEGTLQAYDRVDAAARLPARGALSAHARLRGPAPARTRSTPGPSSPRCKGAPHGPLAGKRVVLKDNICLAGVPMMNGASTLEGYVPDIDATVVTRILDAGGTIVGKAHCEYFCLSGGSHTSALGPVHNPYKHRLLGRRLVERAAPRWSARARSRWRSAATRAARSACRRRSPALRHEGRRTASCPTPASCRSRRRSTTPDR